MATTATTMAPVTAPVATANLEPTPTPLHPRPAAPPHLRALSTLGPVKSEAPPTPSSSTAITAAAGAEDPSYIITVPSYSGNQTRVLAPCFYLLRRLKPGTLIGASLRSVVLVRLHPRHGAPPPAGVLRGGGRRGVRVPGPARVQVLPRLPDTEVPGAAGSTAHAHGGSEGPCWRRRLSPPRLRFP
jgi:hypothetical protein